MFCCVIFFFCFGCVCVCKFGVCCVCLYVCLRLCVRVCVYVSVCVCGVFMPSVMCLKCVIVFLECVYVDIVC